jgi:hypothetical protein
LSEAHRRKTRRKEAQERRTHRSTRHKKLTEAKGAATPPYARNRRDELNDRPCVNNPRSPIKINRGWLKQTRHKIFQASSREYSLNDCFAGSFSKSTSLL